MRLTENVYPVPSLLYIWYPPLTAWTYWSIPTLPLVSGGPPLPSLAGVAPCQEYPVVAVWAGAGAAASNRANSAGVTLRADMRASGACDGQRVETGARG